jgi:acetylornithine deacetylase/succinyl-diaminopimelate desuccinylase-like protein
VLGGAQSIHVMGYDEAYEIPTEEAVTLSLRTQQRTDEVGNLWARVRPGQGPAVVICAHLDTVFDDAVDHKVRRDGTLLRGPGVGDDSVGVAALSAVGALLADTPGTAPVWIVATVGEEGLGNLLGIGEVIRQDRVPLAAVVAGVPAVAIGVTAGGGEHTPDEWIDTSQLGTGLRCAADTITGWERGAREGGGA